MAKPKTKESDLLALENARLTLGGRTLWKDLSFRVRGGEFIAVLGPNGAGKSSLLRVLLGTIPVTAGTVALFGKDPERGNELVGYIPQQKSYDPTLPLRGRDLVQLGLNGYRYGMQRLSGADKQRLNKVIAAVGASAYADNPIGLLSGGEQQRLRIAQALVSEPRLLLCDEPLLSLDLSSQQTVTSLINAYRREHDAAVLFVTHEVNPVLPYIDKILYIANGKWVLDTPDKVLNSDTLSELYGAPIEVLHVHNRVLVVGTEDAGTTMFVDHAEGHHV
jgi:zinc/manganese transport system ATP-binding protein